MKKFYFYIKFSRKDWDQSDQWIKDKILQEGSAVYEIGFMLDTEIEWAKDLYNTSWYRSKEKKGGRNPLCSHMLNKKWTLEEEFNNHMLRFQQVTLSSIFILVNFILTFQAGLTIIEVSFKVEAPDDKPEPLAMEHFYLPLGLLFAGMVISLLCLLVEIVNKWRENQQ